MMTLQQWAARWGVPQAALDELAPTAVLQGEVDRVSMTEGGVQSRVRLEAAQKDIYLWRNNNGAGVLKEGNRPIRWGLANDSARLNEAVKSADLIGIRRTLITQAMVGQHVGVFVSREIKAADWKFSGSLRECAQLQWANLINAQGGDAKIVSGPGSFD